MKILRLDNARSDASKNEVLERNLVRSGAYDRYVLRRHEAAEYSKTIGPKSCIAKINWGRHRIWAAVTIQEGLFGMMASPEIGSRYGEAYSGGMSGRLLDAGWLDDAEIFNDERLVSPLYRSTDAIFDARFEDVPMVLKHAAEMKYDPVSVVRLIEALGVWDISDQDEVGLLRTLRYVDGMRDGIRAVFVRNKEDFAEPVRELR